MTVLERNRADDTFGWGVVLSDDALGNMERNDPKSTAAIRDHFAYWDDIAVIHHGVRTVSGGHGFAGIGRMKMLLLLQERARELGVDLQFQTTFGAAEDYRHDYDLVVACDGINSLVRNEYADVFRPDIDMRLCKFIWLGTHQKFDDAFTFIFEQTEHGWMWIARLPVRRRHRDGDRRVHAGRRGMHGASSRCRRRRPSPRASRSSPSTSTATR